MRPFENPTLSFEERAEDLVSRMTLKEKMKQMVSKSSGISRLNLKSFHWWNECLHRVGRSGLATIFPQAIGLGATFNPDLLFDIATGNQFQISY